MDAFVFTVVLFAAACHAAWNAAIKRGLDPLAVTVAISVGSGVVALPLLAFAGALNPAAWPWIAASVLIHLFYFAALIESYRSGDLGQVYPIARGAAPLLTGLGSTFLIGEHIRLAAWLGIGCVTIGVLLLSLRGGRDLAQLNGRAVGFALFTAVTICAYTLVDGIGARTSENAYAYTALMFAGNALVMTSYAWIRRGRGAFLGILHNWQIGLLGGALSYVAYGLVIWAMTVAPIALVAALRETSVLFGAAIAVIFLKEPLRVARFAAALMIVAGLTLFRLS
jgi:drug/metabolite transporter (DMT)-like permease